MATKDFLTRQLNVSKVIVSGSGPSGALLFYSSSVSTNYEGGIKSSANGGFVPADVGMDVMIFYSGSATTSGDSTRRSDVTVYGGDMVVSGTLWAERMVVEVDEIAGGDFFVSGNIQQKPDTNSTTSVQFQNAAGTSILNIDSTNSRVGIGTVAPSFELEIVDDGAPTAAVVTSYGNLSSYYPSVRLRRARGTESGPTVVADNDTLGAITWYGYNPDGVGSVWGDEAAAIRVEVDGDPSTGSDDSDMPGRLIFLTVPDGSQTLAERMTIKSDGKIGIGTASPSNILTVREDVDGITSINFDNITGGVGSTNEEISIELNLGDGSDIRGGVRLNAGKVNDYTSAADMDAYFSIDVLSANAYPEVLRILNTGNVGIGVTDPDASLEIMGTGTQLKLSYDSTKASTLAVDSTGHMTIENTVSDMDIIFKVKDWNTATEVMRMDADIPSIHVPGGIRQSFGSSGDWISGSGTPSSGLGLVLNSGDSIWISASYGVFFGNRLGTQSHDYVGNDTIFFVSGAIETKNSQTIKGTAVFGGDLVTSGVLCVENFRGATDSRGQIRMVNDGQDPNGYFVMSRFQEGYESDIAPMGGAFALQNRSGSVFIGIGSGSLAESPHMFAVGEMANTNSRNYLYTSGAHGGQVIILSGGNEDDPNDVRDYSDTSFFVSGTIEAKDGVIGGVSVFGGDVVVSGNLYTPAGGYHYFNEDTSVALRQYIRTYGTTMEIESDDYLYIKADNNVNISAATMNINTSYSGGTFKVYGNASTEYIIRTDNAANKVFILSGTKAGETDPDEWDYLDTAFFVSGAIGSKDSATERGVSLFGGDLVVSGAMSVDGLSQLNGTLALGEANNGADLIAWGSSGFRAIQWDASANKLLVNADITHSVGNVIFNSLANDYDFRVASDDKAGILLIDGGTEQIGLLTDGTDASNAYGLNASTIPIPTDTNFFVSGAIGAKGTTTKGLSLFGGDVHVSGTIYNHRLESNNISGSLTRLRSGKSYLVAGDNITIISGSSGDVTIASTGGADVFKTISVSGQSDVVADSSTDTLTLVAGSNVTLTTNAGTDSVTIAASLAGGAVDTSGTPANNQLAIFTDADTVEGDADLTWDGATLAVQGDSNLNGTVVINQSGVDKDFRVETVNKAYAIQTDASTDQVMILSGTTSDAAGYGSSADDPDPRDFTDTNFFVSGSIGSARTTTRGASVFGGDVVVSGSLQAHGGQQTATLAANTGPSAVAGVAWTSTVVQHAQLRYSLKEASTNSIEGGQIFVSIEAGDGASAQVIAGSHGSTIPVSFTADLTGTTVNLMYQNTGGNAVTMKYTVEHEFSF
jgi:hypothetical protein